MGFVQATFCDLIRAFDCINHMPLRKKLEFYGIGNAGLKVIKFYLKNHCQGISEEK